MTKQDIEDLVRDAAYWLGRSDESLEAALRKWPASNRSLAVVRVMHAIEESRLPEPRPRVLELLTDWLTAARLRDEKDAKGREGGAA